MADTTLMTRLAPPETERPPHGRLSGIPSRVLIRRRPYRCRTAHLRGSTQVMSRTGQSFKVHDRPLAVFAHALQGSNTVFGLSHISRSAVEFALRQRVGPATHAPGLVEQLTSALAFTREQVVQLSLQRRHQSAGCEGRACGPPAEPNSDVRTRPIWTRRSVMRAMTSIHSVPIALRGRAITCILRWWRGLVRSLHRAVQRFNQRVARPGAGTNQ